MLWRIRGPAVAVLSFSLLPLAASIREEHPVLVRGAGFPQLQGLPVAQLGLFRYDPAGGTFLPLPYQIDERVDHVFRDEVGNEAVEAMYDVLREDDGLLDAGDELVFLFRELGSRAPADASLPAGADPLYYEIHVHDPRAGAPLPDGWVYLFHGDGLPVSADAYVGWDRTRFGAMSSDGLVVEYGDRWVLTGLRIPGPCGSGGDLIDRIKARAGLDVTQGETEEVWNAGSEYLGVGEQGILGPVRAIRYVRGAASGRNTVHHDLFYRGYWQRTIHLRVHGINSVWHYLDWLPVPGLLLFTPTRRAGTAQEGTPDGTPLYSPLEDWELLRSPEGGLVWTYDVPPSSLFTSVESYRRDDAGFDDAVPPGSPDYPDEDDAAYGNHGLRFSGLSDSSSEPIVMTFGIWPLCGDQGDAALGDAYQALRDQPVIVATTPLGTTEAPIQTLTVRRELDDVVLNWLPVAGSTSYRVYRSPSPSLRRGVWDLLEEVSGSEARDAGAVAQPSRYYSVLPVAPGQREMVDLSLVKSVSDLGPAVGDDVVFRVAVSNAHGVIGAGGVEVTDRLPAGYAYVGDDSAASGTVYDPVGGLWSAGAVGAGEIVALAITATVLSSGDYRNVAEVTAADRPDVNDVYGDGGGHDHDAVTTTPGSVRTLAVRRNVADILLDWQPVAGALAYRVFAAPRPDLPRPSWTLLAEVALPGYVDAGAALVPDPRHYSVVALTPTGEGPH